MGNRLLSHPKQGCFNTLAQDWTAQEGGEPLRLVGNGSDITKTKVATGKAKRKFLTQSMILSIIDICKAHGNRELEQTLWRTYRCSSKVVVVNGKMYTKYCKNRICTICLSNRKAEIINKYLPTVMSWEKPYFITLTAKSCKGRFLVHRFKTMYDVIRRINDRIRQRHNRNGGIKIVGIRSLECNFNPIASTYNPHFNFLVETKEMGELLIKEWAKEWTSSHVYEKIQYIRPVKRDRVKDLIEAIKYGSKIFTEPDIYNKKKTKKGEHQIYAKALYQILRAMKRHRLFDSIGFNLPKDSKHINKKPTVKYAMTYKQYEFDIKHQDWIDVKTGKGLTGYVPTPELVFMLENKVNTTHY